MLSSTFQPGAGTGTVKQREPSLYPWQTHGWQVGMVPENSLHVPLRSILCTKHLVQSRSKTRRGGWERLFQVFSFIRLFPANSQLMKGKETRGIGSVLISHSNSPPSFSAHIT